ncbi:MAG TPA: DUF349 domain-containing protein [Bacteroidales bacterium]|nr:DUF349 domain-containing protein [Bacteroidales bacterium]
MNIKDPKNSVRDEQFDRNAENMDVENNPAGAQESNPEPETTSGKPEKESVHDTGHDEGSQVKEDVGEEVSLNADTGKVDGTGGDSETKVPAGKESGLEEPEEESLGDSAKQEDDSPGPTGKSPDSGDETHQADTSSKKARQPGKKKPEKETVNYNLLSREDLVGMLEDLISSKNISDIRDEVEAIKIAFYKKQRTDHEKAKEEFVANGGNSDEFEAEEDPEEEKFKNLLKKFKDLKVDISRVDDDEKEANLREKYKIIEEIKELVNRDESINKTFQEFRDLQRRWHDVGVVPQQSLKDLWETYHYHVEKFYDYIKINKELRDLDLKKNMESKIGLCEKAEALLLEPNVVNAFQTLQNYHDQWREIGPVPKEKRTEIWERFKDATSKINKRHQHYYQELKESQKKNLESKTVLCEKSEELAKLNPSSHDEWVKKTNEMLELQKVWKTIGFAPKKDNNRIYARFRSACDLFFEKKREFYAQNMQEQQNHLQQKLDLCVQAEALQDSTDWKGTTDEMIRLQKKWKSIGPVPRKFSDEVWKRFRAACDRFFNQKSDFFSKIDTTYEKNLEAKEKLIEEIVNLKLTDNQKDNLKKLNDFQRRWSQIGFVPYEKKDEIMQNFREAINSHYDNLEMDDHKKSMLKFRNKLENISQKPRPGIKMRFEREKLMNKLQQIRNDISLWENNIGFFADTQKAESMVKDFEQKIEDAKARIKLLEEKIILIDELDTDED